MNQITLAEMEILIIEFRRNSRVENWYVLIAQDNFFDEMRDVCWIHDDVLPEPYIHEFSAFINRNAVM